MKTETPTEVYELMIENEDFVKNLKELATLGKVRIEQENLTPKCEDCGRQYGDEHGFPDLLLSNDDFAKIIPGRDQGVGMFCPSCICKRAYDVGLICPATFRSGPFADYLQAPPPSSAGAEVEPCEFRSSVELIEQANRPVLAASEAEPVLGDGSCLDPWSVGYKDGYRDGLAAHPAPDAVSRAAEDERDRIYAAAQASNTQDFLRSRMGAMLPVDRRTAREVSGKEEDKL